MRYCLLSLTLLVGAFFHVDHIQAQRDTLAERFARTITEREMRGHLMELASDKYEGRETGRPGQKLAAAYLADYYDTLGIKPVEGGSYFQSFPLIKESFKRSSVDIDGKKYNFIDDLYFFNDFTVAGAAFPTLVFAGYGIEEERYSDYKKLDVRGKVVVCLMGEPVNEKGVSHITGTTEMSEWSYDAGKKVELARKLGAAGLFLVIPEYDQFIPRVRYWLEGGAFELEYPSSGKEESFPFVFISPRLADDLLPDKKNKKITALKKRIDKKGKSSGFDLSEEVKIHVERDVERLTGENVLCFIEGSDPEKRKEIVVISAHYDHIGIVDGQINNGADDDGSGTVTAMEIAEAFDLARDQGQGPDRSILILHVSGEEKGLLGSEWYSEYPVFPLENTVCDLNIDMVGRKDDQHESAEYVYLIGSDRLSTELHVLSEKMNELYSGLTLDYTFNAADDPNKFYYRSDHYNFAKHGIPVIFYFSGVHEDYHKPGDDPEKILYPKMERIARLIFHTAWEVANRADRLIVDKPLEQEP